MNRWLGTINHASITVSDLEGELAQRSFVLYQPGLHHVAFNSDSHARVDALAALVGELGGTILDGSGEFPFGVGGY
jgi:hypothetical protein